MKTLEQAQKAKERIEAQILATPGVTGIDAGYHPGSESGTPAIRVYVADKKKAGALPAEVDGIPVIVIERKFELH